MKSFLLPAYTLWKREIVRFLRQRSRVFAALGTPLLFWFFLGSGLGSSFHPQSMPTEMHYLEYFYPGTLILVILFTSIFSSISLIEDRKEGFLLSVLVAPISRSGPVLGKILGGATLAFLQGLVFVILAPLAGIPIRLGQLLPLFATLFLIAFTLTSVGFAFAWQMESIQGFHGVMNLVLFPMWLLSGALFPISGASTWVRWLMLVNPLAYGLSLLQHVFYRQHQELLTGIPSFSLSLIVTVGFGVLIFLTAFLMARRTQVVNVA